MEWKFKEDAERQGSSDGFWYDLVDGGYIDIKTSCHMALNDVCHSCGSRNPDDITISPQTTLWLTRRK